MFELIKKILFPYNYSVKTYRPYLIFGFNKAEKITIEETLTTEMFLDIFNRLTQEFGNCIFVHSYYGFIFKSNEKYIAFTQMEEHYGNYVIDIFIFNKLPFGNKITYNRYLQVKNIIKTAIIENGLRYFDNQILLFRKNLFAACALTSNNIQVLFFVARKEISYYISKLINVEEKITKSVPVCNGKERADWNATADLSLALDKIFKKANSII